MPFYRSRFRARAVRYPSRRASASLKAGMYARYRAMRGSRRIGFRGRYPRFRRAVAGNLRPVKRISARTDFPVYLPRTVSIRQEQKYCEYLTTQINTTPHMSLPIGETGAIQFLPLPPRGDALNMRLADRVLINSVIIRGFLQAPQSIGSEYPVQTCADIFIIWDHSPRGVYPSMTEIFTLPTTPDKDAQCGLLQNPVS